jgi:hypothetical protein
MIGLPRVSTDSRLFNHSACACSPPLCRGVMQPCMSTRYTLPQPREACRHALAAQVFSKLGSYYSKTPAGGKTLFAAGEEMKRGKGTELQWLRVYVAAGGPEEFELDGIIWKSSKGGSAA